MSILGDRIKSLRKAKGLNQTELADALNRQFNLKIDRVMISKWETDFQTPVMNSIICLAKFFNVSIDYLNGNTQKENNFTVFAMDGIEGQHSVTVNEEKSEKLAELLKIARDLPDEKIDLLLKMADSIK